jgi:hypothetical protein
MIIIFAIAKCGLFCQVRKSNYLNKRPEACLPDSRQAILPDALQVNANLFQTDLCRNSGYMDLFELTIHGTGYPLPGRYNELTS